DFAGHLDTSGRRSEGSGDDLQKRALAGAVGSDNPDAFAGRDLQINLVERNMELVVGTLRKDLAQQPRRFWIDPIHLGQIADPDGRPGRGSHSASPKFSRVRSKNAQPM